MKKAKKRRSQSRIAMISITFVVGLLFVGMMGKSVALENQLSSYDSQIEDLDRQIEEEEGRTTEIDDLKEYMKTDEYVEETAREKLGLVKENEIVFKEGESSQAGNSSGDTADTQTADDTQDTESTQDSSTSRQTRSSAGTDASDGEEAEG